MTTPSPLLTTFGDGQIVHQTQLNAFVANLNTLYRANEGGFRTAPPLCTVRVTVGQSIPSTTDTLVTWGAADLNPDSMWSAGTPTVVTIPVTGTYFLYSQLATSGTNSQLAVRIMVNGLDPQTNSLTTASCAGTRCGVSAIAPLSAGSVVGVSCYQTNGAPATLQTTLGGCRLAVVYLST